MDINEFKNEMDIYLKELNINLNKTQIEQFYKYMNILLKWNKIMNLTAITDPKEIIIKHFIDSITVLKELGEKDTIIDVGTGAGFPGIPIKIVFPETKIILLDSLNKRVNFLNEVIKELKLKNIEAIHGRAEEYGQNKIHREKYDVAIARAVAPLNILLEYLMPFVKVAGKCIAMKGPNTKEEIKSSQNAIKVLGGNLVKVKEFNLIKEDIKRSIIIIEKTKELSKVFPRKSGTPSKKPL